MTYRVSKFLKHPLLIPTGVSIKRVDNTTISISKDDITLLQHVHALVNIEVEDNKLIISPKEETRYAMMHCGTIGSILASHLKGFVKPFEKTLKLVGVGYRSSLDQKTLNMSLGYTHDVKYQVGDLVDVKLVSPTEIHLQSICKELLGQTAAEIKKLRPVEPYKGKGIRYADETVVLREIKRKK